MKTTYRKMTDLEAKRAEALAKCSLPPGTAVKRFARSLCYQIAKLEISERQAAFLETSCYRFRRQLPAALVPSEPPAAYLSMLSPRGGPRIWRAISKPSGTLEKISPIMLSNDQKARLKSAQRQAGIEDGEYREWLATIAGPGVHSSTDPKVDNRAWDKLMAQFEAIYWLKVERGELQHKYNPNASFQQKGFWAGRNTAKETTRDRFNQAETVEAIISLETELTGLGNHPNYLAAIRNKVAGDRTDPKSLWAYRAALERTLAAKKKKLAA